MKKSLFLAPAVAFGIFTGLSNEASAQELNTETISAEVQAQALAPSSVYENATVIENGVTKKSNTSRYTPVRYFKFYYDGSSGVAGLLFRPEGNHKLNVLNGNFIKVNKNDILATNLTYGWNYVEVIQTAENNNAYQNFEFTIQWD